MLLYTCTNHFLQGTRKIPCLTGDLVLCLDPGTRRTATCSCCCVPTSTACRTPGSSSSSTTARSQSTIRSSRKLAQSNLIKKRQNNFTKKEDDKIKNLFFNIWTKNISFKKMWILNMQKRKKGGKECLNKSTSRM